MELTKEIIERAQSGDIEAQNEVFSYCAGIIRAVARKYFVLGYEQDDLVQEAQLSLFVALKTYSVDKGVPFSAYAKVIAERKIINLIKSSVSKKHAPLNNSERIYTEEYNIADISDTVADTIIQDDDMNALLINAEKVLSERESQVLKMYLEGYTIAEMVQNLGGTNKSVDNAMTRIKNKLRKMVK